MVACGKHFRKARVAWTGRNRDGGLSIPELLVAMAVICLLAVLVLVGGVRQIRSSADLAACVSNERQILAGMLAYAGDHQGRLPSYGSDETKKYFYHHIAPYLNFPETAVFGVDFLRCPAGNQDYATYGINYGPTGLDQGVFGYEDKPPHFAGSLRLTQIKNTTMILADSSQTIIYNPETWGLYGATDFVAARHGGGFNCGFVDGSVRKVTKEEWYKPNSPLWRQPQD